MRQTMNNELDLEMEIEQYSFRHNRKLKRPGVKIPFTLEQTQEIARCAVDPEYFIRTYVKATHPDKGVIPFVPYQYQTDFIRTLIENRFVSACWARQMGKCVFPDAYIKVRSIMTGLEHKLPIGDFYALAKSNNQKILNGVSSKFTEGVESNQFEILTATGWRFFRGCAKTVEFAIWEIHLESGHRSKVADGHLLEVRSPNSDIQEFCRADKLLPGDFVLTDAGVSRVVSSVPTGEVESCYDLLSVEGDTYLADGISGHNSTTAAAYICWYMIFHKDRTIAILANKTDTAKETLMRVQTAYEGLPIWLQQGITSWNKKSFSLENGSRIIACSTSSTAIRGMTISFLFIDEVAFIDNKKWEAFYDSVYPTVIAGTETKIVLISTPNGLNHFYDIHIKAREKRSDFIALDVRWDQHPDRDEAWKIRTKANMQGDVDRKFAQEFEIDFLGSSRTLISAAFLAAVRPVEPVRFDGVTTILEEPQEGHTYVISVDVGEGIEKDYSTQSVIKVSCSPFKQVAVWRDNKISPRALSPTLVAMGTAYNMAYILVESNGLGREVLRELWHDLEYPNVVMLREDDEKLRETGKSRLGILVTSRTKRIGCSALKAMMETGQLEVVEAKTVTEFKYFVRKEGKDTYAADTNNNDDLVMGLVNFAYFTTRPSFTLVIENALDPRTHMAEIGTKMAMELMLPPPIIVEPIKPAELPDYYRSKNGRMVTSRGILSDLEDDEIAVFLRG
jgi:hypothetical protein